jgi:putative membrane protein
MKGATVWLSMMAVPLLAMAAMSGSKDESFFKHAAEGGMAEVEAGKLAQEKGSSQAVKDFGAMMVKDHSAANEKLQALASSEGVKLPSGPSLMQKASGKELKMKSADSFDKAYIKDQIKAHKETVDLFQKEISSGQDQQAQQFASATLPTIQAHLDKINQIATAAGITP